MNYDENSSYGMIFEVDIDCPLNVTLKHEELAFLPERRKINVIEILVTTLQNKKTCCTKASIKAYIKIKKDSQNY